MQYQLFRSVLEQDDAPVVICDTQHRIVYMNPAALARYGSYGGGALVGKSLLACHKEHAAAKIRQILEWFQADAAHNRVHTFYNKAENKDVYMIALRDEQGSVIGYYEKHAYRNVDATALYDMP